MTRPYPPPPIDRPTIQPFALGEAERRDLARVLGLTSLPIPIAGAIAEAVSIYLATVDGALETTVKNTIAALEELNNPRTYAVAVKRLENAASGVDYVTLDRLRPLTGPVLANKVGASDALSQAAAIRLAELRDHKRISPRTEALRHLCGLLRVIFNNIPTTTPAATVEERWRQCRQFATEVFSVAGIGHADFDVHPERLTEYLGTEVLD